MNLEFVCFFVAFEASEAAKFEDGQLAYLDILYLVKFTHMLEIAHKILQLFQMWYIFVFVKRRHRRHKSIRLQHEKERQNL